MTSIAPFRPRLLTPPPTRFQPYSRRELADLVRRYATALRHGQLGPVRFGDPHDPADRWHVRVHADDRVDVWVISWLPTQGTQLHDHGGSSGAFTVVRGTLTEAVWRSSTGEGRGWLSERDHATGSTVAFGPERVHDVRNLGTEPAVSVHAYSSPLLRMGFYDIADGSLHQTTTLDTSDPEPQV